MSEALSPQNENHILAALPAEDYQCDRLVG